MSTALGSFDASTLAAFRASTLKARGGAGVNIHIYTVARSYGTAKPLPIYVRDDNPYGSQIGEFMEQQGGLQPTLPAVGKRYMDEAGGHLTHLHRRRQTLSAKPVDRTPTGKIVPGFGPVIPDVPILNARLDLNIDYKDTSAEDFTSLALYIKERTTESIVINELLPYFQAGFTNAQLIATIPSGSIVQHQALTVNPDSFSTFTLNTGPINALRNKPFLIFAMTSVELQGTGGGVSSGVRLNGTYIQSAGPIYSLFLRLNE
jgi:hypothetical protein